MTTDNIFRYVFCDGSIGGIVIANDLNGALIKVGKYISERYNWLSKDNQKAIVWKLSDNKYVTDDVYEIFNE